MFVARRDERSTPVVGSSCIPEYSSLEGSEPDVDGLGNLVGLHAPEREDAIEDLDVDVILNFCSAAEREVSLRAEDDVEEDEG